MRRRLPRRPQHGGVLLTLLVLLLLGLLVLGVYLLRVSLLRAVAYEWVVDEPLEKAQAIVVLGGDNVQGDRVRHAVELYRQGWAPRVVLSGSSFRTYFNEAELMQREATNLGVPPDHLILVRQHAASTLEEALALRPVLAQHNFRKIIVVTSNFHTRRARRIFRSVYQKQGTQVIVSAAPDSDFNPARWWQQREGRAALLLELLKTVYTWWELRNVSEPLPGPAPLTSFLPRSGSGTMSAAEWGSSDRSTRLRLLTPRASAARLTTARG